LGIHFFFFVVSLALEREFEILVFRRITFLVVRGPKMGLSTAEERQALNFFTTAITQTKLVPNMFRFFFQIVVVVGTYQSYSLFWMLLGTVLNHVIL
jgi:hypothetical protein